MAIHSRLLRPFRFLVAAVGTLVLAGSAPAPPPLAGGTYALRGYVVGNGGTPTGSGTRQLLGTVGQPVVGVSSGPSYTLCHGFWCFGGSRVVAVDDQPPGAALPNVLALGRVYPNPAPAEVRFALDLPRVAAVNLQVLDLQGRRVRVIENRRMEPGFLTLAWDGRDETGRRVRAGVYFARLVVDEQLLGQRRVVLRD